MEFTKAISKQNGHYEVIIKGALSRDKESQKLAKGLLMEAVYNDYSCHLITPIAMQVVGTAVTYSAEFDI